MFHTDCASTCLLQKIVQLIPAMSYSPPVMKYISDLFHDIMYGIKCDLLILWYIKINSIGTLGNIPQLLLPVHRILMTTLSCKTSSLSVMNHVNIPR